MQRRRLGAGPEDLRVDELVAGLDERVRGLRSPKPTTRLPDSRSRDASRVKSLSLETMQKPSNVPVWSRSIASMIIALSVEFFPAV